MCFIYLIAIINEVQLKLTTEMRDFIELSTIKNRSYDAKGSNYARRYGGWHFT